MISIVASSVGEASFVASKRGESLVTGALAHIGHQSMGSCAGTIGSINVGFCEVLDLREASKGEVVTVGVALYSIGYSFFFSGISKTVTSSKGIAQGVGRNSEGV